ncbi:group III truncated hemoglobin [Mucilaginibacter paludis]|uniref:Sec-independent protein translocase protein TatC n=1 Tax=Mucilaginibacter paludis DSM 18603 TaxID=714943 RepID=H1Y0Q4_9SPHI|nr:group III truncated hemoglobin [Mucilaginibacter paludis]EHQ28794.1 sec-independent protein translocase protein TatC [Mucilaginibacter paludis DSM 18603]
MKRLITNKADIQFLVDQFYIKVKADDVIGPIFNDAKNFSWDTHIPVMVSFWETMLLDQVTYKGNPMLTHIELNKRVPLNAEHFERWMKLFFETIDEHFEGDAVVEAKKRATAMEGLMQLKIAQSLNKGFIQ